MALIEKLEYGNWEQILRSSFTYALWILKEDRFAHVGSSVDDIRSWLGIGGISRFRDNLREQMQRRRLPEHRRNAIMACVEQLEQEKHPEICELIAQRIIPGKLGDLASPNRISFDVAADFDIDDLLERLNRGERPFEDWMYAHGYTRQHVAEVYRIIDSHLAPLGIHPPPFEP